MQLSTFIPAAPAPTAAPGGPSGRQGAPREQGFDSVYAAGERTPASDAARDRASGTSVRDRHDSGDTEAPQQAERADRKETDEGEDTSARETGAEAAAASPDVEPAEAIEAVEAADAAAGETPDEAAVAVAETPARHARVGTHEATEEQRAARAAGAQTAQPAAQAQAAQSQTAQSQTAPPQEAETPGKAETAAPAAPAPEKTAPSPAATVQAGATAAPLAADEVVVRRVRTDQAEAADTEAPRVDTRTREAEVKAPKPTAAAMPDAPARQAADPAALIAADPAPAEVAAPEVRTTAEHVARAEATVRHDTPRPVMQQVAEAARALRDGPVELTMQPEELGKVRMTLTAGADGNMTMNLHAERSETLDLMRRHIGELARELQDMGFSNLNFSFGQDRAPSRQDQHADGPDGESSERPVATVPLSGAGLAARPNMAPSSGGLDLRL